MPLTQQTKISFMSSVKEPLACSEILSAIESAQSGSGSTSGASRSFGVNLPGVPLVNDVTPSVFINRPYTCDGVDCGCSVAPTGTANMKIQVSSNGTSWTDLATVSITAGNYFGTAACVTPILAGTLIRGIFTAVNGVSGMVATLYLK